MRLAAVGNARVKSEIDDVLRSMMAATWHLESGLWKSLCKEEIMSVKYSLALRYAVQSYTECLH